MRRNIIRGFILLRDDAPGYCMPEMQFGYFTRGDRMIRNSTIMCSIDANYSLNIYACGMCTSGIITRVKYFIKLSVEDTL